MPLFEWRTSATPDEKNMVEEDPTDDLLEDIGEAIERLKEVVAQFSTSSGALSQLMSQLLAQLERANSLPATSLDYRTSPARPSSQTSSNLRG